MSTTHHQFQSRRYIIGICLILVVWALLLVNLTTVPPLWWDEGWTLTVARTWVERGHYGMLQLGELAPPGLNASFPVTASIALGFKLFGVGVWQGRFVLVLYTFATLGAAYVLSRQLYNHSVALLCVLLLVFCTPSLDLSSIWMGRQVLAETPMIFYLLLGYIFFYQSLQHTLWLPVAILCWGIGLLTKSQPTPFWLVSLVVPAIGLALRRQWRYALIISAGVAGTLLSMLLLRNGFQFLIQNHTLPPDNIQGLTSTVAFVLDPNIHLATILVVMFLGVIPIVGIGYTLFESYCQREILDPARIGRILLALFAGSWILWYAFLSIGWIRYLFPGYFVGLILSAGLLFKATNQLDLKETLRRAALLFKFPRLQNFGALWALFCIPYILITVILVVQLQAGIQEPAPVSQTAQWLNTHAASDARIESYESELLFLLDRPYHFPPDQLHVELVRRKTTGAPLHFIYTPLDYSPDYLVLGKFSRYWETYDPVLLVQSFRLIKTFEPYRIYARTE